MYNSGEITKTDLKNIAALRVGYIAIVDSEEPNDKGRKIVEFEQTVPAPLDDEVRQNIEQDYKSTMADGFEDLVITEYYGKYGEYYVVDIKFKLSAVNYYVSFVRLMPCVELFRRLFSENTTVCQDASILYTSL